MPISLAQDGDLAAVAALVNAAYRGAESLEGWTSEADMIGGDRISEAELREQVAREAANLLILRDDDTSALLGCVMVERMKDAVWYLGMLTVRPRLQSQGCGRRLLEAAETFARAQGGEEMHMTVISVRTTLIAWYERRGYRDTGERMPYPHGDPPRPDLQFAVLTRRL